MFLLMQRHRYYSMRSCIWESYAELPKVPCNHISHTTFFSFCPQVFSLVFPALRQSPVLTTHSNRFDFIDVPVSRRLKFISQTLSTHCSKSGRNFRHTPIINLIPVRYIRIVADLFFTTGQPQDDITYTLSPETDFLTKTTLWLSNNRKRRQSNEHRVC